MESKDTRYSYIGTRTLIVLGVTAAVLFSLVLYTVYLNVNSKKKIDYKQPAIIVSFLDDMFTSGKNLEEVLPKYLPDTRNLNSNKVKLSYDYLSFYYIFFNKNEGVTGYEITGSKKNYVEITMLDANGEPLYPRVAMAYILDSSGFSIKDYTLARLQPFSRLHEEYSELWKE